MESYNLGIDLGTTSVKVSIVNTKTKEIKDHYSEATNCELPVEIVGAHEQFVPKIVATLNSCLSKLRPNLLKMISTIGVCGQMHGVLFWNYNKSQKPWTFVEGKYIINEKKVSRLYTWQDLRCDQDFLSTLPRPESHLNISTGFGIPTIFWLRKNRPEYLKKYNCSGPLSSFIVAMLCDQSIVYTSYQNAASWGYFNCQEYQWNFQILKEGDFPIELLPIVRPSGNIVGTLIENWYGIPPGVPVGVDMGDLQCSVLSTLDTPNDAVINFSTSTQIALVVSDYVPSKGPPSFYPSSNWPYFNNQFVTVAASLNGGNVLTFFVNMLESWLRDLGLQLNKDTVWEKLIVLGMNDSAGSDLKIKPLCLGERFDPAALASVSNITFLNLSLGQVFRALCKGLIENLYTMLPAELLKKAHINRIVGNGMGLYKNTVLRCEVEKFYQLPLVFEHTGDASKGAAIAMHQYKDISTKLAEERTEVRSSPMSSPAVSPKTSPLFVSPLKDLTSTALPKISPTTTALPEISLSAVRALESVSSSNLLSLSSTVSLATTLPIEDLPTTVSPVITSPVISSLAITTPLNSSQVTTSPVISILPEISPKTSLKTTISPAVYSPQITTPLSSLQIVTPILSTIFSAIISPIKDSSEIGQRTVKSEASLPPILPMKDSSEIGQRTVKSEASLPPISPEVALPPSQTESSSNHLHPISSTTTSTKSVLFITNPQVKNSKISSHTTLSTSVSSVPKRVTLVTTDSQTTRVSPSSLSSVVLNPKATFPKTSSCCSPACTCAYICHCHSESDMSETSTPKITLPKSGSPAREIEKITLPKTSTNCTKYCSCTYNCNCNSNKNVSNNYFKNLNE